MNNKATTEENIRVTQRGGNNHSITIEGFSSENLERMTAAMSTGAYFVKVEQGKLTAIPAWEELPKPAEDSTMLPFWRKYTGGSQPQLFDEYQHSNEQGFSPSISIQHLCGLYYTEEGYKREAEKLESYGFQCLRSRRAVDASFWEIWFLPGLWCAKGEFEAHVKRGKNNDEELLIALEFLRYKCSFGTLDVSYQRLAMQNPD